MWWGSTTARLPPPWIFRPAPCAAAFIGAGPCCGCCSGGTSDEAGSVMNDHHVGEWASAYLDGQLEPAERVAVDDHLTGCADCADLVIRIAEARQAVRSLPPVEVPVGFYERLLAGDRFGPLSSRNVQRGMRFGVANAAAAAVIWVLVLGVGNFTGSRALAPSVGTSVSTHQAAVTTGMTTAGGADSAALSSR